jgi:hypothetical protein
VLAGEHQLAALVEEVTGRELGLDRDARLSGLPGLPRAAGDVVVALLPDHQVVVAEHAERMWGGHVVGVDVVHVRRHAVELECLDRLVGVVGPHRVRGRILHRAAVVLVGDDERPSAALGLRLVREARGPPLAVGGLEPRRDLLAGAGALDLAAQAVVIDARLLVVPLATLELARLGPLLTPAVDAVVQVDLAERALGRHLDRLRIAVRDAKCVDVEVLGLVAEVRLRVLGIGRGLREVE